MNRFKDTLLFYTITCAVNNIKMNLFECIITKYLFMGFYQIKVRIFF